MILTDTVVALQNVTDKLSILTNTMSGTSFHASRAFIEVLFILIYMIIKLTTVLYGFSNHTVSTHYFMALYERLCIDLRR